MSGGEGVDPGRGEVGPGRAANYDSEAAVSELVDVPCSTAVLRHLHRRRAQATARAPQPPDPEPPAARLRRPEPLGQALVRRGLLTQDQLEPALASQRRTGERLGRVLLTAGHVHRRDLQEVLADLWDCRFVDLVEEPPDEDLVRTCSDERMVREGWVPVAWDGSVIRVATCERPSSELRESIERALGAPVLFEVTTEWYIQYAIQTVFAASLAHRAGLSERDPEQSARGRFAPWQKVAAFGVLFAATAAAAFDWRLTLIALRTLANLRFLLAVGFKVVTAFAGWRTLRRPPAIAPASIADADVPTYTVLVPVHREANVVGGHGGGPGDHRRGARRAAAGDGPLRRRPAGRAADQAAGLQRGALPSPGASSWSSTTRRTAPSPASCARPWPRSAPATTAWSACRPASTTSTRPRTC